MGPGDVDAGAGQSSARTSRSSSTSARRSTSTASTPRARPSARTAGWTAAWRGTTRTGPPGSSSTGSCRAASTRTCGSSRRRRSPRGRSTGSRSAGRSAPTSRRCTRWSAGRPPRLGDDPRPRHLLGIGDVDDLIRGVELGVDTFDCAMPTRLGRHGVAIVPDPATALARRPHRRPPSRSVDAADHGGLPVPVLRGGHTRGYLRYLVKNKRADRRATADTAQPRLHRAADGGPARRDRGRNAARARRGAARGRRAVTAAPAAGRAAPGPCPRHRLRQRNGRAPPRGRGPGGAGGAPATSGFTRGAACDERSASAWRARLGARPARAHGGRGSRPRDGGRRPWPPRALRCSRGGGRPHRGDRPG